MSLVLKMSNNKLPLTEELDFAYLLTLMPPLHNVPEFAWLPELFSIIGHEQLINLCKYCGGETIRIPTLEQITDSIYALQWFYDVYISKKKNVTEVPVKLHKLFDAITNTYEAQYAGSSERSYNIIET